MKILGIVPDDFSRELLSCVRYVIHNAPPFLAAGISMKTLHSPVQGFMSPYSLSEMNRLGFTGSGPSWAIQHGIEISMRHLCHSLTC